VCSWKEVTLGDVAKLSWGNTKTTKASYTQGGWTAYSASGPDGHLPYFEHDRPGIVISAIGALCGKTWLAEGKWSCIKNTMWMRGDGMAAETPFLFHATRQPDFWPRRGAAQPFISLGDARTKTLKLPSIHIQRRVVAVLSAFDELIEINERRIELLEDLARSLYREWFVHFRFPGHERVVFEDSQLGSIPAGWKIEAFADLAHFLNGFAFKPAHHRKVGLPVIKIKELKNGVSVATPRCDESEINSKFVIEPGDLLFSWSADLGIYLWGGERGALNQHLFKVSPSQPGTTYFLMNALSSALPEFQKRAQGTTMRHIKRSALDEVVTVVPPADVMTSFQGNVAPFYREVLALRRLNPRLANARDLLLPRLVTGQLDISDVDLGVLTPSEAE
jgi:type I restriction enzyme, S subunit